MATIIITKENFGKKMKLIYEKINTLGELKINFEDNKIISSKKRVQKIDPTIRLQKLVDDPENTSYGPFLDVEEAINFLNRDLGR